MKKVVRLTESDLENIISKVIAERLNEAQVLKDGKNRFYLLTPEDEDYKKWLKNSLDNRTAEDKRANDPDSYFADKMSKGSNLTAMREMYGLMDETSKNVFDSMPESFKAYCLYFYKRRVDELKKQFITADNPTTMKQMDPTPGKIQEPGFEFISNDANFRDQFEYNEAVLSNEFKNYINGLAQKAGEALKLTPGSLGVGELKSMNVTASSSRIPNTTSKVTFPGKIPKFCELTQARAKAVEQYVLKAFAAVNIKPGPDFKVSLNTEGTNKDEPCTSGPKWDGTEAGKAALKKYQRADIAFSYAIRTETPGGDENIPDTYEVQTFAVTMGGKQRKKRIPRKIEWPKIDLQFKGGGNFKAVSIGCDMYKG